MDHDRVVDRWTKPDSKAISRSGSGRPMRSSAKTCALWTLPLALISVAMLLISIKVDWVWAEQRGSYPLNSPQMALRGQFPKRAIHRHARNPQGRDQLVLGGRTRVPRPAPCRCSPARKLSPFHREAGRNPTRCHGHGLPHGNLREGDVAAFAFMYAGSCWGIAQSASSTTVLSALPPPASRRS